MHRITMSEAEVRSIKTLLAELTAQYDSVDSPAFLKQATVIAHEMPRRLREFLNDFKHLEPPYGACVLSGYPIDDQSIGRTPAHWKLREGVSPTLKEEMLFILLGSLLGEVIGWATQQNGYVVHDVLPIKDDEYAQISTGSQQAIWWHNEDAFHAFRGDYVSLMCLRNPDRIPTTLASTDMIKLDRRIVNVLFEPRFVIRPDESHAEKNKGEADTDATPAAELLKSAYHRINQMQSSPPKISVLYGDPAMPYIRLDPYFMDPLDDDEAQHALNQLIYAIDACLMDLTLHPGEFLFVDNYRAVHGRKPFKAKYDGTDRWLKRTNITRDLRKSRSARLSCESRIIF